MPTPYSCPACGHHEFEVVEVRRASGSWYRTEFVACRRCRTMSWRPDLAATARAPDLGRAGPPAA